MCFEKGFGPFEIGYMRYWSYYFQCRASFYCYCCISMTKSHSSCVFIAIYRVLVQYPSINKRILGTIFLIYSILVHLQRNMKEMSRLVRKANPAPRKVLMALRIMVWLFSIYGSSKCNPYKINSYKKSTQAIPRFIPYQKLAEAIQGWAKWFPSIGWSDSRVNVFDYKRVPRNYINLSNTKIYYRYNFQ